MALDNLQASPAMPIAVSFLPPIRWSAWRRRVLPKAELLDEASSCLRLLSGRAHRVYTGITLVTPPGGMRHRLVDTRVRFKKLSE